MNPRASSSPGVSPPDLRYLRLLAESYPTVQAASTEIINLSAKLRLPKGTEHFLSDIHGEYEAFHHVLRNGSGSIRRKIDDVFGERLEPAEKRNLATLIYYPEQKLSLILSTLDDEAGWYRDTLLRLIQLCRVVASKYTRAEVREALPTDFSYVIEELLHEQEGVENRQAYYLSILNTIIEIGRAPAFITAMSRLIQRLAIARLHIIGDVYDRGPGAHLIMETLHAYHAVDFQWGNHDIVWMGAAAGSDACLASVIRVSLRYANLSTLETGYGISLLPLASFAVETYGQDPCRGFEPQPGAGEEFTENEQLMLARMHKAITIIQLKLEGQIIQRRPHFQMADRLLLDKIDLGAGTVCIGEQPYPLLDAHFPTLDPNNPYVLTPAERSVVERLRLSFLNSEQLQRHVRFLFARGNMYRVANGNLLYHGCVPMLEDGGFATFEEPGGRFSTRGLMDRLEQLARQGYFARDPEQKQYGLDILWYLWTGPRSPLFGKSRMATFERYFLSERETHQEEMNPYYLYRDRKDTAQKIMAAFDLNPDRGHIINGHVPVKVARGESPVKAEGRLLVIDGGFAKAYQEKTGLAGYTLVFNSYGLLLVSHAPFESTQKAIEHGHDMHSQMAILETTDRRLRVEDTDEGRRIREQARDLKALLSAYRGGVIKER